MITNQDPSGKPYSRCLSCAKFRKDCGGIPTRGLDLKTWCEYMRDVKRIARITNGYIACQSDVSLKTIERIMALDDEQDIMRSTARRIELVIIGQVGKHICDMDYDDSEATKRINALLAEIEHLKEENIRYGKIIDKYLT